MTEPQTIQPEITILPLRPAASSERSSSNDVLIRVTPPAAPAPSASTLLNLALVIDRSSSMQGEKLTYAKQAATFAVQNLQPEDRVSIVTYDSEVQVLVPSTLASDKASIIQRIESITAGGMTALHSGWLEGAAQASAHLEAASGSESAVERLNRVILLSDGQANRGECNPDVIASDVAGLSAHGVSTTTLGVGRDFNEDLLQGLADSGDGNFYFIESPEQLPAIFNAELQGLIATRGTGVRLEIAAANDASLSEILNDFNRDESGRLKLPNLVAGMPLLMAVVLQVPALAGKTRVAELTLSWDDTASGQRETLSQSVLLDSLPEVELQQLTPNPEVVGYFAELQAARAKEQAIASLDRGDQAGMQSHLQRARDLIQAAPASARRDVELHELEHLAENDVILVRKQMHDQVYCMRRNVNLKNVASKAVAPDPVRDAGARITVKQGDLTREQVDAIVNPTNTGLYGTGGVDGAVHRAGGEELTRACRKIGRCEPGEAVFTEGFNLPARFVIHTVGPRWRGGQHNEKRLLANSYRNSLQLASKLGARTVAFPSISTGISGFPLGEAAEIAITEIQRFQKRDPHLAVRITCFDEQTASAYERALQLAGQETV